MNYKYKKKKKITVLFTYLDIENLVIDIHPL